MPSWPRPRLGGGGGRRQLLAAPVEQGLEAGDARALLGVGAEHLAELADLIGAVAPFIVIIGAGLLPLVEHVAAERRLGAGDGGVDRAGQHDHLIGAPFPAQRLVAGAARRGDEHDEDDERQRRRQRAGADPQSAARRPAALLGALQYLLRHERKITLADGPGKGGGAPRTRSVARNRSAGRS